MPSRVLNFQTPHHVLLQSFPNTRILLIVHVKVFGCTVFVHIHTQHRSKLDQKALKCIFVGYSSNQNRYKCYFPVTRKFYNSMDVSFFENQPYYKADIQGENSTQEYQHWDIYTPSPVLAIQPESSQSNYPVQTDSPLMSKLNLKHINPVPKQNLQNLLMPKQNLKHVLKLCLKHLSVSITYNLLLTVSFVSTLGETRLKK